MNQPASRPALLIAWRNTQKILEIEALVTNLGNDVGRGRVSVDVLDEAHRALAHEPSEDSPFVVQIPGANEGGKAGVTVQIPGTYGLNQLLDGLDRAHDPYCLRVKISTLDALDENLLNNSAIKCYNTSARLTDRGIAFHRYYLRNNTARTVVGEVLVQRPPVPKEWHLDVEPAAGTRLRLKPGQFVIGSIIVRGPTRVQEGDYLDIRPTLVDKGGNVIDGSEFYVAADSHPPKITHAIVTPGRDEHSVYLTLRALDPISGVAEASGASVEWSTDDGFTMNKRTLTYQDGNFLSPTGFDTDLGPFAQGSEVRLRITVRDVVGNGARTNEIQFNIPLTESLELTW